MVVGLAAAVAWRLAEAHRLREPDRIVRSLVRGVDRELADKTLRALSLVAEDGAVRSQGTSADLALLHAERMLARLPSGRVLERAANAAGLVRTAAVVVAVSALGLALANAWSVLEGADVLVARRGVAPFPMTWLRELDVVARPPDYLHDTERRALGASSMMLPYGTAITVRGVPVHLGRHLFLSDGDTEVPFGDDGAGGLVARWSLTKRTSLRVVARFGEVTIPEGDALMLESIPDLAPEVTLEDAPRQVLLLDQSADIPLDYLASDDHGLREVELVLRSGTREDRRVLAHLDGDTRLYRGGQQLRLTDAFIRKSHAPIRVTIEARDNDPLLGPKWGASPPITLIPPEVGEPQARRLAALRKVRDTLVDGLAWRLANEPPSAPPDQRKAFIDTERSMTDADEAMLKATLAESYGGVRVPGRLRATLGGQVEKTRKAVEAELRAPSAATHAHVVQATERFILVLDAVIRGLGVHDTREAARELADVAEDLALGAVDAQRGGDREARVRTVTRMDAATLVLAGGGRSMLASGRWAAIWARSSTRTWRA
jgi:hypothetical protein